MRRPKKGMNSPMVSVSMRESSVRAETGRKAHNTLKISHKSQQSHLRLNPGVMRRIPPTGESETAAHQRQSSESLQSGRMLSLVVERKEEHDRSEGRRGQLSKQLMGHFDLRLKLKHEPDPDSSSDE